MNSSFRHFRSIVLLLGSTVAIAQPVPPTGSLSFEDGSLAGWTVGGNRVAVGQNSNFGTCPNANNDNNCSAVPMPAVPSGARFAVMSNGPGGISNATSFIDNNTVAEYDVGTLTRTFEQQSGSAVLLFSWNFPSSEQDQTPTFDDLFDVSIDGQVIFARSAPKTPGSTSNYPDTPFSGYGVVNWRVIGLGNLNRTILRFGVGAWQRACVPIPAPPTLPVTRSLRFRMADQGDNTFDSALLLDQISIASACETIPAGDLEQLTNTDRGQIEARVKDGLGFGGEQVDQSRFSASGDGQTVALVSTANFTGDNPNRLPQVFLRGADASYQRIAAFALQARADVHSIAISGDGNTVALAADRSGTDNLEIYSWNRSTGVVTTITATGNCSNKAPALDQNGSLLAFESDCPALTGANAGVTKVVYRRAGVSQALPVGASCAAQQPAVQQSNNARYLSFASTCGAAGGAATSTAEIFRFDTNGPVASTGSYLRLSTQTSSGGACTPGFFPVFADNQPTLDSGDSALFISSRNLTGQNADCSPEIYRYRFGTGSGDRLSQVTSAGAFENLYIRVLLTQNGGHYLFERLSGSGSQVGYRNALSGLASPESLVAEGAFLGVSVGVRNNDVLLLMLSPDDFAGENPDGNYEVFRGRVQP